MELTEHSGDRATKVLQLVHSDCDTMRCRGLAGSKKQGRGLHQKIQTSVLSLSGRLPDTNCDVRHWAVCDDDDSNERQAGRRRMYNGRKRDRARPQAAVVTVAAALEAVVGGGDDSDGIAGGSVDVISSDNGGCGDGGK